MIGIVPARPSLRRPSSAPPTVNSHADTPADGDPTSNRFCLPFVCLRLLCLFLALGAAWPPVSSNLSCPVLVLPYLVLFCQRLDLFLSCSYLILSCSCLVLSYLILSCLVLSYLVLSYLDLFLPCIVLFCCSCFVSVLPGVNDTVYEECNQDSPFVWNELPKEWMPDDQLLTVWIFRSVVLTVVI